MKPIKNEMTAKKAARQSDIILASLELLQENGLEGITLRKLAARLDMQAPTLYWYFKDKRALTDFMADKILQDKFDDLIIVEDREEWQEWLKATMLKLRQAMLHYRDGGRVVTGAHLGPGRTLAKIIAYSLESLQKCGLTADDSQNITMTALHFTFGRVIEEQESPSKSEMKEFQDETVFVEYPYLNQLIHNGLSTEEEFRNSLKLIIK